MNKQEFKIKLEDLLLEMQDMSKSEQQDCIITVQDCIEQLIYSDDALRLEKKTDELLNDWFFTDPSEIVKELIVFLDYVNF